MRILIIGPSIKRSKGGTATVISEHMANPIINKLNQLTCLESHVDGNKFEKVYYLLNCIFHILIYHRRYDIVHIHANSDISLYRKTVLVRVSKWVNKKTFIQIHGHDFDSFYQNNKPWLKRYIKETLYKCDKVIVLSEYWKLFFDKEFNNLPVEILYNGLDVKAYEVSRR